MAENLQGKMMVIGIDLGGMSAKAACLFDGKLTGRARVSTSAQAGAENTAKDLARLARECALRAGMGWEQIDAVGVGCPGVIDAKNGKVAVWSNFGWEDVPLAGLLEKDLQKPVFLINDANAAALGEGAYGAGGGYEDSVFVAIGTGVGGGIILGGKLYEGFRGAGGEIGHMVICRNGKKCTCGRRGCLEAYASTRALIERTKREISRCPEGILASLAQDGVDGKTVFQALKRGDPSAKKILREFVCSLGEGIANLANLFRPQAFLIGGAISAEGETLLRPLREYVFSRCYAPLKYAPFEILAASLGNDANLFGAAEYARRRL